MIYIFSLYEWNNVDGLLIEGCLDDWKIFDRP